MNSVPKTAATTFAFSSVYFFLYGNRTALGFCILYTAARCTRPAGILHTWLAAIGVATRRKIPTFSAASINEAVLRSRTFRKSKSEKSAPSQQKSPASEHCKCNILKSVTRTWLIFKFFTESKLLHYCIKGFSNYFINVFFSRHALIDNFLVYNSIFVFDILFAH